MLRVDIKNVKIDEESGSRNILENIKFNSKPNTVNIILGRNGTGKSILIKSLTKLENKNNFQVNGKVYYDDLDLLDLNEDSLNEIRKTKIRYVFQDAVNLFDPLKKLEYYFKIICLDREKLNQSLSDFLLPEFDELKKCMFMNLAEEWHKEFQ
jgi:peptide/nickel transport system ATP-binding protein